MALQGKTRISLYRKGIEVKRIEKKNTITGYVGDILSKGNYGNAIDRTKILPLKQWFNGIYLTSENNDATTNMIASNSDIVACAGDTGEMGDVDLRRGRLNLNESSPIPNGYQFVWDWPTDRGNGDIKSVCLTRASLAIAEISTEYFPSANPFNEVIGASGSGALLEHGLFSRMQIIDYDKEVGYRITYADDTITIREYNLSTYRIHLVDTPFVVSETPDAVHTISKTISNPSIDVSRISIGYTKKNNVAYIHIITWSGSRIKDYVIDTNEWAMAEDYGSSGVIDRTFTGATFTARTLHNWNNVDYAKVCPITGDYIWMYGVVENIPKILKCNLLGSAATEIIPYDHPFYTKLGITNLANYNGCAIQMPNGDFFKTSSVANSQGHAIYFHNNRFYMCKEAFGSPNVATNAALIQAYHTNNFGSYLRDLCQEYNGPAGYEELCACHGWVSTVNNLEDIEGVESVIHKNDSLTMKVSYSITEVTS